MNIKLRKREAAAAAEAVKNEKASIAPADRGTSHRRNHHQNGTRAMIHLLTQSRRRHQRGGVKNLRRGKTGP